MTDTEIKQRIATLLAEAKDLADKANEHVLAYLIRMCEVELAGRR